jgi:hypothetical protein
MQEVNPSRKIFLLKSQGEPKIRWLESVEEDLKNMAWGNGDVSSRRRRREKIKRKKNTFGLRDLSLPIQTPL